MSGKPDLEDAEYEWVQGETEFFGLEELAESLTSSQARTLTRRLKAAIKQAEKDSEDARRQANAAAIGRAIKSRGGHG
jgi:hypothetical protein